MKRVHAILSTVGLVVIVGFLVAPTASDWKVLALLMTLAGLAGLATGFAVPRETRLRVLGRVNPAAERRVREGR